MTMAGTGPQRSSVTSSILLTGTPTKYTMLSVRGQPVNSKAYWQLVRAPLTEVGPQGTFELAAYFRVSSAPPGSVAHFHFSGTYNGASVLNVTGIPYVLPSNFPYTVWDHLPIKVGAVPGPETFTVRVTINGLSTSASTNILLTKQPSPSKAFSFSLQRLQLLNDQRHPQSRFSAGAGLWVRFRIIVSHLPGQRESEVSIVYVDPRTRKALFKPVLSMLPLRNGRQTAAVHLLVPGGVGPRVYIAVGLTLAGKTHSRQVALALG